MENERSDARRVQQVSFGELEMNARYLPVNSVIGGPAPKAKPWQKITKTGALNPEGTIVQVRSNLLVEKCS